MDRDSSKLGNVWRAWGAGILVTAAVLLGSSLVLPAAALALDLKGEDRAGARITIELIDKSVRESLATIADLFGIPIEVVGLSGDERRISVIFRDATLQKSLQRILASLDYVAIHTSQGSLSILVIDRDPADQSDPAREQMGGLSDPSPDQFPTAEDLFPPDDLLELARKDFKLENDGPDGKGLDLNDPDLFPPDWSKSTDFTPAGASVHGTARDSQRLETVVLPPSGEELRLLLEDLDPIQPRDTTLAPTQFDVLPPDFDLPPTGSYMQLEPRRPVVEDDFPDSLPPPPDILESLVNKP